MGRVLGLAVFYEDIIEREAAALEHPADLCCLARRNGSIATLPFVMRPQLKTTIDAVRLAVNRPRAEHSEQFKIFGRRQIELDAHAGVARAARDTAPVQFSVRYSNDAGHCVPLVPVRTRKRVDMARVERVTQSLQEDIERLLNRLRTTGVSSSNEASGLTPPSPSEHAILQAPRNVAR